MVGCMGMNTVPPLDHVGAIRKFTRDEQEMESKVKHCGGCHCGQVRFEVWAPKNIDVYDCK